MRPSVFHCLHPSLQEVIQTRLAWRSFRDIQEETYHAYSMGKDLLIMAPTASGKSEAAFLPVIDTCLKKGGNGVFCIYIAPQKALINDMEDRLQKICSSLHLTIMKWHGDIPAQHRTFSDDPPQFLLTTPESLEVMMHKPELLSCFRSVQAIIIDEIHTFVPVERGTHLRCLLDRLDMLNGHAVVRIGLSATIGNPDTVALWLSPQEREVEIVSVPTPPAPKQIIFSLCDESVIPSRIAYLAAGKQVLVFVESRTRAEQMTSALKNYLPCVYIHHASLAADTRHEAEQMLVSGTPVCLVCTSTMELGIDIGPLEMVIQVGSPRQVSSCIQRLGRTGRRGTTPTMAFIVKNSYELAQTVAVITCAENHELEDIVPLTAPYQVLVQQILLFLLHTSRAPLHRIIWFIQNLSVFHNIPDEEIEDIISYLIKEGFVTKDGDLLMTGSQFETSQDNYSRGSLYSTIARGSLYTAYDTSGEEIGSVDPLLIRAAHKTRAILLGGTVWKIISTDFERMTVQLIPAEDAMGEGALSFWSGTTFFSSSLIAKGIQRIIEKGGSHLVQDGGMAGILQDFCRGFPDGIAEDTIVISHDKKSAYIYSFLGYRWNQIIAACIQNLAGPDMSVTYRDLYLVIRGPLAHQAGDIATIFLSISSMKPEEILSCIPFLTEAYHPWYELIPPRYQSRMWIEDRFAIPEMLSEIRKKKILIVNHQTNNSE